MIDASVLVVGGGAIGGVTAAKLTGAVRRVVVLDANADHVARCSTTGAARRPRRGAPRRVEAAPTPAELRTLRLRARHAEGGAHEAALPPLRDRRGDVRLARQRVGPGPHRRAGRPGPPDRRDRRVGRDEPRARATSPRRRAGRSSSASSTAAARAHTPARRGAAPAGDVRVTRRHPRHDLGEAARQQRLLRPRRGGGPALRGRRRRS